ncbi:protein kinase domain-containing protein [Ditylenchus destructor]|uniref:Protein kinase domain-containing protein n=1 Tax=Ditylenchus destructor TaxID=166010 RepID=A0AAD4NAN6_9BILA|nr:protein kinase domain-containing protein [Ditylenchus destructor]
MSRTPGNESPRSPSTPSTPSTPIKFNEIPLEQYYDVEEEMGSGQFAVVKKVVKRATGEQFAAKYIKKRRYANSRRGVARLHIEREVEVLRSIGGHPNVIELFEVFETPNEVILILELVSGGELFDHVCSNEYLNEKEASAFIRQILYGVQHLHSRFICHLDIKPENVMLKKRGESQVKLIDFGLSRMIHPGVPVKDMIGTPEFVAPEVVNYEPLSTATDMWAIGVVCYILLCGASPFLGRTREETFCNITGVNYHFSSKYFANVSDLAKEFISRLFVKDVRRRATVEECLNHPWIRKWTDSFQDCQPSIINTANIKAFKIRVKWRRALDTVLVCNRIVRNADQRETQNSKKSAGKDERPSRIDPENVIASAIFVACEEGNLATLEELSNVHRLSLDISNSMGETPLMVAAGGGFDNLVAFLRKKGCLANMEDHRGDTALFWAVRNGHGNVVRMLFSYGDKTGTLLDVNKTNKSGESALHVAVRYSQTECVLALLEYGADPDIQDEHGETCVHTASWHGNTFILSILCRFGPSLGLRNQDEETALHCASLRGHLECVQSLVENGAPINALDQCGQTALHLALRRCHVDVALFLITKDCQLDIQDENGDTPLHIASQLGLNTIVQTLCHLGAKVDLQNSLSQTPLHVASQGCHVEIVRYLCLANANVNLKTKDGLTAEIISLAHDNTQIGSLLSKMRSDQSRQQFIKQLYPIDAPLPRIKLKLFGHSEVGKSKLVQALQTSPSHSSLNSIMDAVSRRFSDNMHLAQSSSAQSIGHQSQVYSQDEGIDSSGSSSSDMVSRVEGRKTWPINYQRPTHTSYTHGIDVQNVVFPGCGEFSIWEFGGYEPYHIAYDHFVGNSDCIHVIVIRASDPTEVQYKQALYWFNFLKGRVTPSEPIGHCGVVSRRSKVVVVGTCATPQLFPQKCPDGNFFISSDAEAMMKTLNLRFDTHFDIFDRIILLDTANQNCAGLKSLREYLHKARDLIIERLQKPLALLDVCVTFLSQLRKRYTNFPIITWPHFSNVVRTELNPLATDSHCRQLVQQLQLIGEVVYLRDEASELDYVVLTPEWLGTHIIGTLLSAKFLSECHTNGSYSTGEFSAIFPEIAEPGDLLHILDTLQLCAVLEAGSTEFEFPAFILDEAPMEVWQNNRPNYVYGGMRIVPMRGMERSLQSTFPRIQVAMRRSMRDFQDPMDAELSQWRGYSKMCSGQMEALIRLHGDAVEVQVRGPSEMAPSCVYFLEDIANLVEQTASEVAPGISIERHFLSPKHLKEHKPAPATFPPEEIMAMQQRESLKIRNSDGEEEMFTDVVCFGSREVAALLTLGIDVSVSQLQLASRCELAALLDPPESMGRDWSILAVKLNLADQQIAEVDSTGLSLSRTDQLLAEWALQCPEVASVGRLCAILEEMGRLDARDALYRTVPLYLFAPLEEQSGSMIPNSLPSAMPTTQQPSSPSPPDTPNSGNETTLDMRKHDSGVVSLSHSTIDPRSCNTSAVLR